MADANTDLLTSPARPISLSVLISAPLQDEDGSPVPQLAIQRELDAVADACRSLDVPVALNIDLQIATAKTLQRFFAATNAPVDILHFSGHGIRQQEGVALLLEDVFGVARPLTADELGRWLKPLQAPPCRIAVLNACYSQGLADALLRAGVAHVIAIDAAEPVLDIASRVFAEAFYPSLLAGRSVSESYEHARNAVLSDDQLREQLDFHSHKPSSEIEALKFRLLPQDDLAHRQPLFRLAPTGQVRAPSWDWERTNLSEANPNTFVGRLTERQELLQRLAEHRCVLIHAFGGMGKTALADVTGRWLHERQRYRDGVRFVSLQNVPSTQLARDKIAVALRLAPEVGKSNSTLADALRAWSSLLILDDLDMLLDVDRAGLAELVRALLGCRQLHLMATSRRELPDTVDHNTYELLRFGRNDAYDAFVRYASPINKWGLRGGYDPEDLSAVMQFLDGYPFPIRLAATYMKRMRCTLQQLRRSLIDDPKQTLHLVGEDAARDTSLFATLDLSFTALPDDAKTMLPLLALFPAGLTRDAAREIIGHWSETALITLLDHAMAEYRYAEAYERFALPEPARRYAEKRQQPDVMNTYGPSALAFFYALVQEADENSAVMDMMRADWF